MMRHQQPLQAFRLDHPCHHACQMVPSFLNLTNYFSEGDGGGAEAEEDDEMIGPLVGCLGIIYACYAMLFMYVHACLAT